MSKSDWLGIAVGAISVALSFLLAGPVWGCAFLLIGVVCLVFFFSAEGSPSASIVEGISARDYEELQTAVNRRRESEIQLRDAERAEVVRVLADEIDVLYRQQQRGRPAPIIIPEQTWMELYKEHAPDLIRDALRARQAYNTPIARFGRFVGRFRQ